MKKTFFIVVFAVFLFDIVLNPAGPPYVIDHQVSGIGETNTYLLYDCKTLEGALFDPGGAIDTLDAIIHEKGIKIKYIFFTHCHCDHVFGFPEVKKNYPDSQVGFSWEEYEDTALYADWENMLPPKMLEGIKKDAAWSRLMNFDFSLLGKPDIRLVDGMVLRLGELEIRTLLSPGHSRGSICFYVGGSLFSGDVLFYRTVGRVDLPGGGGKDAIVSSVRRLYSLFPDETKVYPGHSGFTDIGSEKKENLRVTVDGGQWGKDRKK